MSDAPGPGPGSDGTDGTDGTDEARPPLFLVTGTASAEEVAALTVVLQAVAASGAAARDAGRRPRSQWSARDRQVRQPLVTGPGAWRASALPR